MARKVRDEGRLDAKLVLIGEAPGQREEVQGRPFVGPSGIKLASWWEKVGLCRKDFYITNVYPFKPLNNKIETIGAEEMAHWIEQLHERLSQLTNPYIIIPTGNTALQALTGKSGILKYRGSILSYMRHDETLPFDDCSRVIKCIPTLHPAFALRDPSMTKRCLIDWAKIKKESQTRKIVTPERTHIINPDIEEIIQYADQIDANDISIDIETNPDEGEILCVGFAQSIHKSFTIPTTLSYWGNQDDLNAAWSFIEQLCDLPNPKVMQNGFYDQYWLSLVDSPVRNFQYDTMLMHHCIDSKEPHALGHLTSIYTDQPYHKEMYKDPATIKKWGSVFNAFLAYNGLDCCVTLEISRKLQVELRKEGKMEFYLKHYRDLYEPTMSLMLHGMKVESKRRKIKFAQLRAKCIEIEDQLEKIAGEKLHAKKGLSSKRIQRYLYETLKIPKVFKRGRGTVTADEVTIRKLILRYPKKLKVAGQLILDHRKGKKLSEFLEDTRLDPDGRIRCSYGLNTSTGRFKSSKNPKNGGANLQNSSRECRDIFLPDEGMILLEGDESQAESRVVGCLTGDASLIELAKSHPAERDVHTENAAFIFKISESDVSKKQRYLGKRAIHACYDAETEVLTKSGWVRFDQLKERPTVAQWNARTGKIQFARARAHHKYDYVGKMCHWEAQAFSQFVTPNHRMPYETNRKMKEMLARDYQDSIGGRSPLCGDYRGTSVELQPWIMQLIVATQADGHIVRRKTICDQIVFHFKKQRKIDRLIAITPKWLELRQHKNKCDDSTTITLTAKTFRILDWLTKDKKFDYRLLRLSARNLDTFLAELKFWDGSFSETKEKKNCYYYSAERQNVDVVQTIAHLRNQQCLVRRSKRCWRASFNRRKFARNTKPKIVDFSGKVYCLTMPSGGLMIRRNGKISCGLNSNYGMKGFTLSDILLKDGTVLLPAECQRLIDAYTEKYPAIPDWQRKVRLEIMRKRMLTNDWGRTISFEHDRLTDNIFREGYAFVPQSDIAELTNQFGLIPVYWFLKKNGFRAKINLQVHDALVISTPPEEAYDIAIFMAASMQRSVVYAGVKLSIPVEFKLGTSWKCEYEFKRLPSRKEFTEIAHSLLEGK